MRRSSDATVRSVSASDCELRSFDNRVVGHGVMYIGASAALETIVSRFPCSEKSFALPIEDRANAPELVVGNIAIIDPAQKAAPGNYVLVYLPNQTATVLRRYRKRETHIELTPIMDTAELVIWRVGDDDRRHRRQDTNS